MFSEIDFPRLTADNHRVTSPPSPDYNCVAWAAEDTQHWWQPGVFWPAAEAVNEFDLDALVRAFAALGFSSCDDDHFEPGYEKVALFAAGPFYTHAARQLPNGRWTSKLGRAEDIDHDSPEVLGGGVYGEVQRILKRPTKESP